MTCFPIKNKYKKTLTKSSSVVFVTPCIGMLGGEATLFTHDSSIRWESEDGNELQTSECGKKVSCLTPGRYSVSADDNDYKMNFEVNHSSCPTITAYKITHASGELSRDGDIEIVTNVTEGSDILIAWSNACFTTSKKIHNVKPGVYVATILQVGGKTVPCVHSSQPATVGITGENMLLG